MILNRLYDLALRKQLLDDPAFETQPVPYHVVLDEGGKFLGITEHRGENVTIKKTKKGEAVKRTLDRGRAQSVPRPHGNTASQGFARFFVDTLPRVLPVVVEEIDRAKIERSRNTFWAQIATAAVASNDTALQCVQAFGKRLSEDETLAGEIRAALEEKNAENNDRVTFEYHPDGGPNILARPGVRKWYADFFTKFTATKQKDGRSGFCTLTGRLGPLPASHPMKLSGIPGGLPTGVSLVSFDKAAFQHYGLDGAENAAIGYEGADGYARAFQWLRGNKDHHLVIGGTLFLFWTKQDSETDFIMALDRAEPEQVKNLLERLTKGQHGDAIEDPDEFYLLAVSGNSARAIIREYLERPLGQVRSAIGGWFKDLRIADSSREHQGQPNAAFPMWMLASATAFDSEGVAPDTHSRLMRAALTGRSLPDSILAACLGRLRAEGSEGFRTARLGLIKLCLNRNQFPEGEPMNETLDADATHKAYLYGRLLRIFEEIQYAALGDVNANVVDKFYSTFSAAPALVFARLYSNAQNHLRKLRSENPGTAVNLDKRLADVSSKLPASPPSGTLSLQDQGRFALGYYHQKARTFAEIAERRAEKAAKAESK